MKKALILISVLMLVIIGAMIWLASSVGPETAPQEIRSIELPDTYGN